MSRETLKREIEAAGFRHKIFGAAHLEEISKEFEGLVQRGLMDEDFYRSNLTSFRYDQNAAVAGAKSVIMMAAPQVKSVLEFIHKEKTYEAVIPPTYVYPGILRSFADILDKALGQEGYKVGRQPLPLKLLAVRSGLGQYGRNNICYVPGFGSFHRLGAYITDCELGEDSWGEVTMMESCHDCTACMVKCPTGAIDGEQFLIHAQNCMTNFNEYDTPIPSWVEPDWHDSLVGCMKCQEACPHNRKNLTAVEARISFDEEETNMILDITPFDRLREEMRNKIAAAGMEDYYHVMPRNMRLLMK